jgi:hypothetical protein
VMIFPYVLRRSDVSFLYKQSKWGSAVHSCTLRFNIPR